MVGVFSAQSHVSYSSIMKIWFSVLFCIFEKYYFHQILMHPTEIGIERGARRAMSEWLVYTRCHWTCTQELMMTEMVDRDSGSSVEISRRSYQPNRWIHSKSVYYTKISWGQFVANFSKPTICCLFVSNQLAETGDSDSGYTHQNKHVIFQRLRYILGCKKKYKQC